MSIAPYLKGKKVLLSTLYCGVGEIVKYGNWLVYPTTATGLTLSLGWYAADQGYKKMITVGADYAGGHLFMKGVKVGFEERGGKVIQELWPPVGTTDYGPTISNLNKDADVVACFLAGAPEFTRYLPQYREFGVKIPLLGTTLAADLPANVMAELGDKVRGLRGQAAYIATREDPVNQAFQEGMNKRFGAYPGGLENNSYCVAKVFLAGLEATGGDDSLDKLRAAILASKIDTPQGPLSWTKSGVAVTDGYIAEAKEIDGNWVWDPIKIYKAVKDPRFKD